MMSVKRPAMSKLHPIHRVGVRLLVQPPKTLALSDHQEYNNDFQEN